MKYLTSHVTGNLSAAGARPVVLATLTIRSATGGNAVYRWASQSDGSYSYRIGGTGDYYGADLAELREIVRTICPLGGIAKQSGDDVVLVNPDENGSFCSDLFDSYDLDEALVSLDLVFADGSESTSDVVRLAHGFAGQPNADAKNVRIPWREGTGRQYGQLLSGRRITQRNDPFAPSGNWGMVRPVVLGDLRGQAFDVSTPADGDFPHVPTPAINAQRQRFSVYDTATGSDRETLLTLYDHIIQIPSGSHSLSGDYMQIDSSELLLLLRPHRIDDSTQGVVDPEHASTHDLARAAKMSAGTLLIIDVPGANANLGGMGAASTLVAGDVTIHVVYSKVNQSDSNPGQLTIRLAGVGITGHMSLNLNGSGTSVESQTIGDHLTGWDDLRTITVLVSGVVGTSGVEVKRVLVGVVFRCDEVRAPFTQQQIYRAQQGFIESSGAATDDYQDGTYLNYTRTTTPLTNPADIAEALMRHREWGLGLHAPSLTDTSETLDAVANVDTTSWTVSDGSAFDAGDLLFVDREVATVQSISGDTLTVIRGAGGSRPTCHSDGALIYRYDSSGEIDAASFRGTASILYEPDGTEFFTNGAMEGTYVSGIAPNWTKVDPDAEGSFSAGTGYVGRYAQQVERTGDTGLAPGTYQVATGLSASEWYRLRLYARALSGSATIECAILQSGDNHYQNVVLDTEWQSIDIDFKPSTTTPIMRFSNVGDTGTTMLSDGYSLQRIAPWQMDFALTEPTEASSWLDETFLPQSTIRLQHGADGRIAASAGWTDRPSSMTLDDSHIVVDTDDSGVATSVPLISFERTPLEDAVTGVSLRYAYNRLTDSYDGVVDVSASRSNTGQTVTSVASGSPLDTLTVASSTPLAPKDAADETGSNIVASGTTITLPSGDLVNSGVEEGDWLIVQTSYGTFLHQIADVTSATQLVVSDYPPQFADLGQWSAGDNIYLAGNEIFGSFETPTGTTATIFRGLDSVNLTTGETMQAEDVIWALSSTSDDGTETADQSCYLYDGRERTAMFRVARHRLERTLSFDASCIRDRGTALALRNRLFDAHDRGWLIALTTDLSTLALDVGDHVTVEHEVLPNDSMTGEIIRQSIDVGAGRIEYVVRAEG